MVAKYSPSEHLIQLTQSWIGTTLIIGAILFPLLGLMDYFVSPELFTRFISYRIIISALLCVLYVLNKLKRSTPYQYIIISVGTALSAATIELAVVQHGGQSSTYYAGMGLVAICALGFVPISLSLSYALVAVIYGIYLVPILLTESITNGVFISNNGFMISTFTVALIWRHYNQKLIMTELTLRDELSRDKEKLRHYSTRLEDLVAEQTGALAVSEQRYRELFENANDGIAVLDKDGIIVNVNSQFCKIHGYDPPEVLGAPCPLIEAEPGSREVADRMKRILNGEAIVYETEHLRKDGSRVSFEVSSKAINIGGTLYIQAFHRDITEKKKLQDQLLQSQKMESMGVLAGGIAHDFNNILTAILGHAEVLRRRVRTDEFAQKRVKTIEDAAKRAGQMVSKLLSFARKEIFEMVPTDLNEVVKDTMELLERTFIDRKIAARVELAPGLPAVKGDSIHLEQVITNLVMNAMDAMPQGGVITITTSLAELGNEASLVHPLLTAGRYAVLMVADTGAGISPEILDRVFDPFFTTKALGKGTGLGLAMVYGIVKSHKGEIRVESREGKGTTFSIFLPALDAPVQTKPQEQAEALLPAQGGIETVLVVDDEKDILSFIKDILDANGYKVLVADNPVYALDLFLSISAEIDLVITDMLMSLVDGGELSRKIKEIKPAVKVIGISGFNDGALVKEAQGIDAFMKKPFDVTSLLFNIRKTLDAGKR